MLGGIEELKDLLKIDWKKIDGSMDSELYFSYRFLGLKSQKDPLKGSVLEKCLRLYGFALHIGLLTEQLLPKGIIQIAEC